MVGPLGQILLCAKFEIQVDKLHYMYSWSNYSTAQTGLMNF